MLTGGFVPQIAAFVAVGNADGNSDFDNKTINGVYHRTWFGSYIATPTWKNFMDTYLTAINAPNVDYGTPSSISSPCRHPTTSPPSTSKSSRSSTNTTNGTTSGTGGTGDTSGQYTQTQNDTTTGGNQTEGGQTTGGQ